ncbi:GerMN domain-containing protein [Paenibacillus pinistramenti]|uniref:GerMN domain-containing protein n=1 Tax=Paenibacillus pinistramenti TaxID=1768003 RepID=UPI001108B80C|nr:GerMN domain-containing protein [Paenibacillus pinistramenti]
MKRIPHWKMTAAASAVALPLLLSGCSLAGLGPSGQIDAPPANAEAQMLSGEIPTAAGVQHDPADLTTVYLSNGQGLLAPVSLPLNAESGSAQTSGEADGADSAAAKQTSATSVSDPLAEDSSGADGEAAANAAVSAPANEGEAAAAEPVAGTDGSAVAADDDSADSSAKQTAADASSDSATSATSAASAAAASNETLIKSLETLVINGPYQQELPVGFSGILPEGTEVKSVTVKPDQKLAVVEFSKAFTGYDKADERKILEAVTWTMTEQTGVNAVEVWVDGQRLSEMPVDHTPIPYPLTRAVGINLELDGGAVSQTTPVTVYFTATAEDGSPYFVPVTRFVPNSEEPLKAALGQLISGPQQGDGLEQVLTETAALKSVEESKDGVVSVSLTDDMFESGERIPAEMLEAVVLTVTENAKGSKVNITFNGSKDVVDTLNKAYSNPVTRPEKINDLSV